MKLNGKIIWISLVVIVTVAALYVYREYNRKPADITSLKPELSVDASDLIAEFNENDSLANKKYLGKLVEVSGSIGSIDSSIQHITLVLGIDNNSSSIRCNMDSSMGLPTSQLINKQVRIKGICTGFIPGDLGLGSDIILDRAIISSSNNKN